MTRSMTLVALFLAVALVGAPEARGAELATWDQEKVTAIAAELTQAAAALRGALQRRPPPTLGQPGKRAFFALREEMQFLVSGSRRLHNALADGADRDETYATYRRLLVTARRAAQEARRAALGEPALGKIEATADVIRRIRPFYEVAPPL